ncbi:MAG: hypothetical protein NVSMB32_17030 [Actinomycetota bacterium]
MAVDHPLDQESGTLEMARRAALLFTMTVAILSGIAELAKYLSTRPPVPWLVAVASVLEVGIVVGGVIMGLLYVLHLLRVRKQASLNKH